jgi:hypothetical protein
MPNAAAKPGTVTYAAHVAQNRETGNIEIVVTRDIVAGVCGPALDFETPGELTLNFVELQGMLAERGYRVVGDWKIGTGYEGMWLEVEVLPL